MKKNTNMADPLASNDPDEATPRWVKVFGIIFLLLLLAVVLHKVSGGHGPGQHLSSMSHTMSGEQQGP